MIALFYVSMTLLCLFCFIIYSKYIDSWDRFGNDDKFINIYLPALVWPLLIPALIAYLLVIQSSKLMDSATTNIADAIRKSKK